MSAETTTTSDAVVDLTTAGTDAATVLQQAFDAVARKDLDAMSRLWDDQSTNDYVALQQEVTGVEALRAFFAELFAASQDQVFTTEAIHPVDATTAVGQWHLALTFDGGPFQGVLPNGKRIELRGCDVMEVRDGKVRRNTVYYDTMTWAKCIGMLPPTDSRAERALRAAFNARTRMKARLRRRG